MSGSDEKAWKAKETDPTELVWRAALWPLEALPPSRRDNSAPSGSLRQCKFAASLETVIGSGGAVNRALHQEVVSGWPFMHGLMCWASCRGVDDRLLHGLNCYQGAAGKSLVLETGSPRSAHAALVAFARRKAHDRDAAFSERDIRTQTVSDLLAGLRELAPR